MLANTGVSYDYVSMSERCRFVNQPGSCPVSPDLWPITGMCEADARGKKCGPAIAFETVLETLHGMEAEDVVNPISGVFQLLREPNFSRLNMHKNGRNTIAMKQVLIGQYFPIRQTPAEKVEANGLVVTYNDLVLSLYSQGKIAGDEIWTDFLDRVAAADSQGRDVCVFEPASGELTSVEQMSSMDFYGGFLPEHVRHQMEDKLFTGYKLD